MKSCLVLVRNPKHIKDKTEIYRSEILYDKVVKPAVEQKGFTCERIDPHDYGVNDSRLFNLIQSADLMIVDASANSMDYMYSLGVRHALTDKPTFILVESGNIPVDVSIPVGMIPYEKDLLSFEGCFNLQVYLSDFLSKTLLKTELTHLTQPVEQD